MNNKKTNSKNEKKLLRWKLAQKHPIAAYLLLTFAWSWLVWLAAIPLRGQNNLLLMTLVFIGGYGPAVGGVLSLGLRNGVKVDFSRRKVLTMLAGALVIFALMAARYIVGNVSGYESLPENLTLSVPILAAAVFASLVGGWVISSAFSSNGDIREKMASILPSGLSAGWTLLALSLFAAMVFASWGLAVLFGMQVEYPGLWGRPALEVIPLLLLSFLLTAFARGGNEEPGWRGMMQPELQRRFSPLAAALIVSVFWSLWHLPLYLNGFYGEELLGGMIGGGIYRILLSIFMAWFYNRSGGKMILMVILHTSFNMMVNFIPTSDAILAVLWLVVVLVVVFTDKMYKNPQKIQAKSLKTAKKTVLEGKITKG